MTLPLTKTLDPADFDRLPKELAIVDQYFTSSSPQHPMRRWEYAMALDAMCRWGDQQAKRTYRAVDVGGGGSPFWKMMGVVGREATVVVDPVENYSLAEYIADLPRLSPVVTCLSVLEHIPVEELDRFLYHLGCLVAPGGLLFLTVDCCGDPAPGAPADRYHFHWMRRQIFSHWSLGALVEDRLRRQHFSVFGDVDHTYHGDHVYDYSFASLALQKRA